MKKIISLISTSFILLNIISCSSANNPIDTIQMDQPIEALAQKASEADALIKKMVDKRFTFADKNKDKKLVFSEFKGLESEHDDVMQKMFDSVDINKDKIVTYDEFVKADTAGIKNTLNQMFRMMDRNRNNLIEQGEELNMIVEVAQGTAVDAGNKVTTDQVKKDFLSYDANKDGKLSLDEYLAPEMKYILMAPVDPYKNTVGTLSNPVSMNKILNAYSKINK